MSPYALFDLTQRLDEKALVLDHMAADAKDAYERARLAGKAEGLRLAAGFVRELR